ncbi:ligand-binding sensor domain-containing diguanylate cyclase [Pseudolysobacter antarcticus]|uniref:ligand-binding sensor domain-containing diguanylate cyclase n=1 Tax=Pseudolysobacter antarcticus TaxID=2511995 RepID=UPI0013ED1DCF|nr:ligand-binding sensor domain-containing diguanylate cyclase [Pseudolysobacter antarcticus]
MKALLILYLLLLRSAFALDPNAHFQDYVLDNWNTEDGLPQVSVLSVTQDAEGYLWVGTQAELARFDGVRFTVYGRKKTDGIDTSMVGSSLRDSHDRLWFGTPHGLLLYSGRHFQSINLHGSTESVSIQGIAESSEGNLLFATPQGILRYQDNALVADALPGVPTYSVLRSADTLWIGLTGAVAQRDAGHLNMLPLPAEASSARVTHLANSAQGLWVGTNAGLYLLRDGKLQSATNDADLDRLNIESLHTDHDGNVWVATVSMLYRVRPNGALEKIDAEQFVPESWISSIFEDREHNLWLGSTTESLFRLHNGWLKHYGIKDGLLDRFTWSVARDGQGRVAIGTNSGVSLHDEHGLHLLIAGKTLPNPAAYELFYDSQDRLWIGTRSGIAVYADGKLDTPPALATLAPYQINAIVQTGTEDFWIGSQGGLYRYHAGALSLIGAGPGSAVAHVRSINVVNADELLVGTEAGLRHVKDAQIDTPVYAKPLEGIFVTTIASLRPGLIGIGTLNAGIGLLGDNTLLQLTTENGLPGNNAWTFRVVSDYLYVGSTDGVWRVPLNKLPDITRAGKPSLQPEVVVGALGRERPGQRTRCCNGGANSRSVIDGDNIWFPTMNGPIRVDTSAIAASTVAPTAVIEGLNYHGQWHEPGAELQLSGGPRDLEIQFTGLYFHDPRSLHFRYKLEGYDADWIDAGPRRSAYYTNLSPGTYRFNVIAKTGANLDSTDTTLNFSLIPRWHENAFMRALFGLLAIALVVLVWLFRTRAYRRRQQQLEVLVNLRTDQLRYTNKQLAEANQTLTVESNTDPLTGLPNRRYLLNQIQKIIDTDMHAGKRCSVALLLIDMDDFKIINDDRGHVVGDHILQQFAQLLMNLHDLSDLIARWGGDEFLLVLHDVDAEQALTIAEGIRKIITEHNFAANDNDLLQLKCSIGVALHPPFPDDALLSDWSVALELADMALNRIKLDGGNRSLALVAGSNASSELFKRNISARVDKLLATGALRLLRGKV